MLIDRAVIDYEFKAKRQAGVVSASCERHGLSSQLQFRGPKITRMSGIELGGSRNAEDKNLKRGTLRLSG
jgi:hypothetical protein